MAGTQAVRILAAPTPLQAYRSEGQESVCTTRKDAIDFGIFRAGPAAATVAGARS